MQAFSERIEGYMLSFLQEGYQIGSVVYEFEVDLQLLGEVVLGVFILEEGLGLHDCILDVLLIKLLFLLVILVLLLLLEVVGGGGEGFLLFIFHVGFKTFVVMVEFQFLGGQLLILLFLLLNLLGENDSPRSKFMETLQTGFWILNWSEIMGSYYYYGS